jgi:hypothetical protein
MAGDDNSARTNTRNARNFSLAARRFAAGRLTGALRCASRPPAHLSILSSPLTVPRQTMHTDKTGWRRRTVGRRAQVIFIFFGLHLYNIILRILYRYFIRSCTCAICVNHPTPALRQMNTSYLTVYDGKLPVTYTRYNRIAV